ncbi:unnamed protein product, partial [Prorocentrum cordatum]
SPLPWGRARGAAALALAARGPMQAAASGTPGSPSAAAGPSGHLRRRQAEELGAAGFLVKNTFIHGDSPSSLADGTECTTPASRRSSSAPPASAPRDKLLRDECPTDDEREGDECGPAADCVCALGYPGPDASPLRYGGVDQAPTLFSSTRAGSVSCRRERRQRLQGLHGYLARTVVTVAVSAAMLEAMPETSGWPRPCTVHAVVCQDW